MSFDNGPLFALAVPRIETNEGFRPTPYKDTTGKLTIGYGRCDQGVVFGMTCTTAEAEAWLRDHLTRDAADLDAALPWWRSLDLTRQSVLLEMTYNMGLGEAPYEAVRGHGLLSFTRFLADVQTGRYGQAAGLMLMSLWARQVGERAMRLSILMKRGTPQ